MYTPTIGLEIHAELKTKTKMFCDCANDPDETLPNMNVCPVCMAHPGTLPVINREAVRQILRIGAAVGGVLADFSEFDRKSYFYPDIPKGYQISQYEHPFIVGGELAGVVLTRIHLEEDTARSIHANGKSLIDFNRSGVPLMELVTEPVIHDAETASRFARELQLLLRTLSAGEANLEKGEMRIEANVSVSKDSGVLGTKVEVKNLNSFRSVERAIAFEIKRQTKLLEQGGSVVQETRGWDESKQETFHQRFKEGSADYRYFPEPDLPKLYCSLIPEFSDEEIQASLPELPWDRRARYERFGIRKEYIDTIMQDEFLTNVFEKVAERANGEVSILALAANYLVSDLIGLMQTFAGADVAFARTNIDVFCNSFFILMGMTSSGSISSRGAKDILAELYQAGGDPEQIAEARSLLQVHDTNALTIIIDTVLAREGKAVEEYKSGKQAAIQYLVGRAMQESKGAGNPQELRKLFIERLG